MNPKILVYGFYGAGKNNLGDDLFMDAFRSIFPSYNFEFTDHISEKHLQGISAIFFGGGSFLGEPIQTSCFERLKKFSIFYIGVGAETDLHPMHQLLIPLAKLVSLRSDSNIDYIKSLNSNVITTPDLVYALQAPLSETKINKSILFIPNISVVPKWNEPHWKHSAWDFFKIETSQLLDELIREKYTIRLLPFCINGYLNDNYAAVEIVNRMTVNTSNLILPKPNSIEEVIKTISQYELVVTQRFHGTILSNIANTKCLTIYHHDKLKNSEGNKISYYSCNKNSLKDDIEYIIRCNMTSIQIDKNLFANLRQKVDHALCGH